MYGMESLSIFPNGGYIFHDDNASNRAIQRENEISCLTIEQHEPHLKPGVNSGATEGLRHPNFRQTSKAN